VQAGGGYALWRAYTNRQPTVTDDLPLGEGWIVASACPTSITGAPDHPQAMDESAPGRRYRRSDAIPTARPKGFEPPTF
jgi:hypothetical protein